MGEQIGSLRVRGAVAFIAFVVLAAIAGSGVLASADRAILDAIQTPGTDWLDLVASVINLAGPSEITGSIALGIAIVWLRHGRRDWWTPLLIGVVVAVEVVGKTFVPHPAPPDEVSRGIFDSLGNFVAAPTPYAFPSGHAARVAFLVTVTRAPLPLGAAIALTMAICKIYLGDHWPSESLGGLLLGFSVGALARRT